MKLVSINKEKLDNILHEMTNLSSSYPESITPLFVEIFENCLKQIENENKEMPYNFERLLKQKLFHYLENNYDEIILDDDIIEPDKEEIKIYVNKDNLKQILLKDIDRWII